MRIEHQFTIDQLAERLVLSRSTIYYWVRDLPIAESEKAKDLREAARRRGNRTMQRRYRLLREQAYETGKEEYERLVADPTFRDFVCLYIGEGYKRNRNVVSLANSDPAVVCFTTRWFRRLSERQPKFYLQYHADQDLDELGVFWSATLDVHADAIKLQRKSNSNQMSGRIWRCKHGVMTARVDDTLLRARIQAWIDLLKGEWQ